MITGKTGYFDLTGSVSSFTLRINWSEEYDVLSNKSVVWINSVQVRSTKYANGYYPDGIVKINGQPVITMNSLLGTHSLGVHGIGPFYDITEAGAGTAVGSAEIIHNTDGSGTVTIEVTGNRFSGCRFIGGTSNEDYGWYVMGGRTEELTHIPRASTIAASDGIIGETATVSIQKKSAAYTHSVGFSFGTLNGYITQTGAVTQIPTPFSEASVAFNLPESFYYEIPDASFGVCTLTCTTYLGTEQIGQPQMAAFTVTANQALCAPEVSGTVEDINPATLALTGDASVLVLNASTAVCTIHAEAKYGASIAQKYIDGKTVDEQTRVIEKIPSSVTQFVAIDSRGYGTGAVAICENAIAYVPLTLGASVVRTDPTSGNAQLTVRGNCYCGSFGLQDNELKMVYSVDDGAQMIQSLQILEDHTYRATIDLSGLDYQQQHILRVQTFDAVTATEIQNVWLGKGIPVFDWGENDVQFHVPVDFEQGLTVAGTGLTDVIYPVGSVYFSIYPENPSAQFGGIWRAVENPPLSDMYIWQRVS